uniref:Uncharacterized protein n=1 Tax=Anguilla anguilla TaxID=7936 RepID=A0A0E9QN95_ANGAN
MLKTLFISPYFILFRRVSSGNINIAPHSMFRLTGSARNK